MAQQPRCTLPGSLEQVPDPRHKRGQRFEWRILIAIISAALAAGQKTPSAMAAWVKEHAPALVAQLHPAKGRLPSATTLWRVLWRSKPASRRCSRAWRGCLRSPPPVPALPGELLVYRATEKGHGRLETRTLECSTALNAYLDWPGVGQVMRRTCRRVILRTGQVASETHYGITSLGRALAGPQELEFFWRGHWTIENCDHYIGWTAT